MAEYNPSKIIKDGNTYNFRDTTKIPLAGSNQISGDLVPATTDAYDLGGSSYQWNNAYIKSLTINGVACGDILTHDVSEFVNVTGAQTVGGVKTFSAGLFASKSTAGDLAILEDSSINSTNEDANGMPLTGHTNSLKIKGSQFNVIPCMLTGQLFASGDTSAELRTYKYKDTTRRAGFNIRYIYASDVAQAQFISCDIITSADGVYNIGSSIARWKNCYTNTINGLNPGALSLWSNNYIHLDTTNFDVTSTTIGTFTPTVDGWVTLNIAQKNKPFGIWLIGGTVRESFQSVRNNDDYFVFALMPVRANVSMTIYCTADDIDSTRRLPWLRLSLCQGNV